MKRDSWKKHPPCRLCRTEGISRRQRQIHKGICAREAAKVGYLRPALEAFIEASLAFYEAYDHRDCYTERMAWQAAARNYLSLRSRDRKKKEAK